MEKISAYGTYAMAIDPASQGRLLPTHVSLYEAGTIRHSGVAAGFSLAAAKLPASSTPLRGKSAATANAATTFVPHTPVISSAAAASPDQWDSILSRVGQKYNVPPLFLKAVMLSESGGRPDAVGDSGHSVGLFQLHDQGYGFGMGDKRYDPETNADRAAKGLAEAWHAGENAGFSGEYAVRAAYNYSFNPGGGWGYQGDSVVANYNKLLAAQGQPALA